MQVNTEGERRRGYLGGVEWGGVGVRVEVHSNFLRPKGASTASNEVTTWKACFSGRGAVPSLEEEKMSEGLWMVRGGEDKGEARSIGVGEGET